MSERITMSTAGAEATVVKRATGSARRAALAAEAATLQAISHPGVVRFVDYRPGEHHDELVTELAGSVTLADLPPRDTATAAGILAGVGSIVADLHATGLAHGALTADHVVLGGQRHPVLCSLGAAMRSPEAQAGDMKALGQLAGELVEGLPAAGRRQLRALRSVAQAAAAGEIDATEFARRCAAVPDARVAATGTDPRPEIERPAPVAAAGTRAWRHRIGPVTRSVPAMGRSARLGALLFVAVLTGVVAWAGIRGGGAEAALATEADPLVPAVAVGQAAVERPARVESAPPECVARPDVDGDGCADEVEVVGTAIRVNDEWFVAGEAGDVVIVGHWGCSALATPAVLRPSTGEVFVFAAWPTGAEATLASVTEVSPGAAELRSDEVDGCDQPLAAGTGA